MLQDYHFEHGRDQRRAYFCHTAGFQDGMWPKGCLRASFLSGFQSLVIVTSSFHSRSGTAQRRADIRPFPSRRRPLGDTVTLFVDRCVMCSRCVRFTREISGTSELYVEGRGSSEEIAVFPGYPLDNKMSGNMRRNNPCKFSRAGKPSVQFGR